MALVTPLWAASSCLKVAETLSRRSCAALPGCPCRCRQRQRADLSGVRRPLRVSLELKNLCFWRAARRQMQNCTEQRQAELGKKRRQQGDLRGSPEPATFAAFGAPVIVGPSRHQHHLAGGSRHARCAV